MAFAYKRAITIDSTKCGTADSANFPVYYAGHADLATIANGGFVRNANGYDIAFFSDAALTQGLAWETVSWSATTGLGEWHIKLPTLSTSANTLIYVAFGDASVTTDQSSSAATWFSAYKNVSHWGAPGASPLNTNDSTSNSYNPTASSGSENTSAGLLAGNCATFSGSSYLSYPDISSLSYPFTFSYWFKYTGSSGGVLAAVLSKSQNNWRGFYSGSAFDSAVLNDNFATGSSASGSYATGWHYQVNLFSSPSSRQVFIDNVSGPVDTSNPGDPFYGGLALCLGASVRQGTIDNFVTAYIDEFRLSVGDLSGRRIAEYNNQSSPSTFYSHGAREAVVTAATTIYPVFSRLLIP